MVRKLIKQTGVLLSMCALICCPVDSVYAQDSQATEILQAMSAEIASLDRFVVSGDGYVDARLDAGQIIEHSMDATMRVSRPGAMRITNIDAESTKEIHFNEGVLTVYSQTENFYAQTALPAGIDAAANFAVNELDIDVPMLDFVFNDVGDHLVEDAQSVEYLGLSRFRGKLYHHIGIRALEDDLQVWIAAEGPPLPGKLAISAKWDGGAPRSVFFFSWDTEPEIDKASLRFEPPPNAVRIEFDLDSER
ncbi:MAG: DUF2092 domain-containing protein [Halioglobus sp.]